MVEPALFDIYLCDHCDAELYSLEAITVSLHKIVPLLVLIRIYKIRAHSKFMLRRLNPASRVKNMTPTAVQKANRNA